jgi:methylglyoxal/glyoxal reductase
MLDLGSTITLNNDLAMPLLGLGVWAMANGSATTDAVSSALRIGYRLVDTAKIYGNEEGVGEGLRGSGVPRKAVWVTTKLWPADQLHVRRAFDASLQRLRLDYIDLYLVHWPTPGFVTRTWKAMESLCDDARCRSIGVSNHSVDQLSSILRMARIRPAVNQVKCSPFGYDRHLLEYCIQNGIVVQAYSPLTRGRRLGDPRLLRIAETYHKTPAQILIRWALQKGTVALPKAQREDHKRQNADVFDFAITPEDMERLDLLG